MNGEQYVRCMLDTPGAFEYRCDGTMHVADHCTAEAMPVLDCAGG
jgi:hypothetical protein